MDTVRNWKKNTQASTQAFLQFWEIKDSLITLKNGWVRAVLETSSINFNLKSEEEQKSIIYAYQGFLNSLNFPIQILVRSRKLDVDSYLSYIDSFVEKHDNPLLREQTQEYSSYISKLIDYANIMEKHFYVVVPVDGISNEKKWFFDFVWDVFSSGKESPAQVRTRLKNFEKLKKKIKPRIDAISSGLWAIWLNVRQLSSVEIIELLYQTYNPLVSKTEKKIDFDKFKIKQNEIN